MLHQKIKEVINDMKTTNNKSFYILLSLIMLISFLLGLFLDWEKWYYSSSIFMGIGVIVIRILSSQIDSSVKSQNTTFIFFSILNFIIYSVAAFLGYRGGMQGMMLVLPVLVIIGYIYVKMKERISNKVLNVIIHSFIVICFMLAMQIVIFAMGLAGMGV